MMIKMRTAALCLAAAAALAGCGTSTSSGPGAISSQHSALKSAEANPSVEAAVAKAKKDVITPCIASTQGVTGFITCAKGKVPAAQRKTVGKCLAKAALADHKKGDSTYQVEQDMISVAGPACIAPALP
jgi:hypothetical protein